jgi:cytochrome c peroxidase
MDNTPATNPITDHGATLGRVLFYDVDLSANRTISCASCHQQKFSFSDTARFSIGFNGQITSRNSMGLIHARFQRDSAFFWDNRAASLEQQVLMPIVSPVEMGLTIDTLVARVSSKGYYSPLFQNAFGDPTVTSDRISKAMAQFIRSMNTFGSKFRQGVDITNGPPESTPFPNFTAQENLGKDLFMDINRGNCQACHTRNVMVQQGAQNIGLDLVYADNGVGAASGRQAQNGKFSVPSLINVELTPPYMHDGRFRTLEQVVDFYSDSVKAHVNLSGFLREIIPGTINPNNNTCDTCPPRRPHFTPTEKAALVAFLKTLTDTLILTDQRWSNPFRECSTHNTVTTTSCGSYVWNGITYTTSGTYTRSYLNSTGCPSVDTLHLTIRNKPLPPTSITISLLINQCGNRVYRYTAPALTAATTNNVAASGYAWTMPTGPVGSTGVLDSGSLSSRIIRIKYTSNAAATSLDSIRVAYTSTCGNSLNKAVKLNNLKKNGCGNNREFDSNESMQFSVVAYPNITSEEFSVQLTGNTSDMVSFMVYDTQGKLVDSGILNSETKLYIGAQYQPGLYLLVAVLNNEKRILRLVKQ